MTFPRTTACAILSALALAGCGSGEQPTNATAAAADQPERTCDSIRSDVIRIAATNGVTIVKIYDPTTVSKAPDKVVCTGRVLVSSGKEGKLYYRDAQDPDGDWLVQYSDNPLK